MPGTSPIQLGSAVSGWTFEAASSVEESASGIQTCTVSALWPIGSTVLSNLPAAGSSVSGITSYIPSDFLLDYTEAGPGVDYIEGTVARVKFKFKRQDPNRSGATASRNVFADTILNYDSDLFQSSFSVVGLGGTVSGSLPTSAANKFGFPEPTVTVVYNSATDPAVGIGDLSSLRALSGSAKAQGFPPVNDVIIPISYPVPGGSLVQFFDGVTYVAVTPASNTTFNFNIRYKSNPGGWQLTGLKYNPVANRSFFDVEEKWRNFYVFFGVEFVSSIPALP